MEKPKDVVDAIKEYEQIVYHQGKVFSRFREKENFFTLVSRLGIHKNAIVFQINIFKLINKHPRLMKSAVTLSILKNYLKDVRQTCPKNVEEFE